MASTGPAGNVSLHIGPDVPFRNQATRGQDETKSAVCQRWLDALLRVPEDGMTLGDITKKSPPGVRKRHLCKLQ